MKITVRLETSQRTGHHTFNLDDLGLTEQEWNELSDLDKEKILQKAIDDLPEHPYWMLDAFDEK